MKNNFAITVLSIVITVVLPSCKVMTKPVVSVAQAHTSQNSLDWQGTYSGVLPCAGCAGRAIQLSLSNDGMYTLNGRYNGSFTWQGNTIILFDAVVVPPLYKVGENQLIALDSTGALMDKYILKKSSRCLSKIKNGNWLS